ncbi:MAG TPA: ABC transporter ATP-binding protein [Cyanobacteria bacterium UBA11369]|nr:ABC transporter ATP-binding protein [Cyanobacteria bacterium UBA11371]HBE35638.1 ABC transporter ATP-binding protein [Cyanobacteria bacterium UBA11368]HBE48976.1 ABC transporter ATP-binding protein [Cyanobacteria bacterium UBA11369]
MSSKFLPSLKSRFQQTLYLGRALRLVWESGSGWTIARGMLLVVQGTLPLLSLYLSKLLVDSVTQGLAAADKEVAFRQVLLLICLIGIVVLASAIFQAIGSIISTYQAQVVSDYINNILHSKAIEMDLEYYENSEYYDILSRAQQEASNRSNQILNRLVQIGQSIISLGAMAGLLIFFNWGLTAIMFVSVIPRVLVRLKYTGIVFQWHRKRTSTQRRANYYSRIITNEQHAKEIRLFNLGHLFKDRYLNLRQQLRREQIAISIRSSLADLATRFLSILVILGSYGFIAYQTVRGNITLGDLVMYNQAFQQGYSALWEVFSSLSGLYEDNLFISHFYEFLHLNPKVVESLHPKPVPQPMVKGIEFVGVSFQYPNSTRKALEDINLTIRPGEVVALVGENGCGKTTLVKLLCRLYDPTAGKITLDRIDLCEFATQDLRRQISVIFQDYVKYHLTARENIWFGNIDCLPDDEKIVNAARHSGADEVIAQLPQSYDSILGKQFEQGEELSIGQWQKVAIARAFMRESQLIVLDEPTSALDPKAEYEVFKQFRKLLQGQSAILISHRLSTVKMADCIYVLEHGKIVEKGSHDQLMRLGGIYAYLFETQAQNYR